MSAAQHSNHDMAVLRVALPLPVAQTFDYLPAGGAAMPGSRVRVPFGRGQRTGIVVEADAASGVATARLKPIDAVLDAEPLLPPELLASLQRAAAYWCGAPGEVLFGALPVALRDGRPAPQFTAEYWRATAAGRVARTAHTRRGGSAALLEALGDAALQAAELDTLLPGWRAAARRLASAALIERAAAKHGAPRVREGAAPILTDDQADALAAILGAGDGFRTFLLQGVTGSGKTEIYLRLTAHALQRGRQAVWLVPEIGLVPQALRRLRARFDAHIAVLHSNLAEGERTRAWLDARDGSAAIVVGTRSAIFAPLARAGLIVVDEEHDASYKQQEGFRYHARDFALLRAQALDVPVVLGSATPALETLANVEAGRYVRVNLPQRIHAHPPSPVHVLDLRGLKLEHGLSPTLLEALDACVARGEQALVFKNRRGYAPVLLCHACGWHATCPACEKPLTLYRGRHQLACHHCGHHERVPASCPQCGATALLPQGQGTERIEEALAARYPDVPVIRIDRDSTRQRDAFAKVLDRLANDAPAILVGTQILAKGHDLPNLTMVAIVGVDEGLHSVDFHAGERLAQLIVQVAGRAGRASKPGQVWLQTHEPDHPLLTTLLRGGYAAAAALETGERLASGLPPFGYLALLRAECRERSVLDAFMAAARRAIGQDVRFAANDDALTDNGSAALGAEEPSPSIPLPAEGGGVLTRASEGGDGSPPSTGRGSTHCVGGMPADARNPSPSVPLPTEGGGVLTRASEGGDGSPPSTGRGSTHSVGGMLADARNPSPSIPLSTEGGGVPTRAAEGGGVPTHPAEGRRGSPPSAGRGSARSAGGMPQPYANAVRVSGPFDAPMPLRAGRHRAQLLIEAAQRPRLRQVLDAWLPRLRALPQPRGLRWSIDIDPVDLY